MDKKKLISFQMNIEKAEVRAKTDTEDEKIVIEGYASTPDIDSYNSIIATEAIAGGMERYMNNPVVLLGHDTDKPIGKVVSHTIDSKGLNVRVEISEDIDGIMKAIKNGVVKGFSIGFYALQWTYETKQGLPLSALSDPEIEALSYDEIIRKITQIELLEVSIVSVPSNPNALFTLTRAIKRFFEYQDKETAKYEMRKRDMRADGEAEVEEVIDGTEPVSSEKTPEEVVSDEKEEETEIEEPKDTEDKQGDEVEASGENPEPPATEDTDPKEEVETPPANEEPTKEELEAQLDDAMELLSKQERLLQSKNDQIKGLTETLNKTPAKRGFVNVQAPEVKQDALMKELEEAKARA